MKEMKKRVDIINESGTEILWIDFSNLSGDDFLAAIDTVKNFCLQLPKNITHPSITDMTNAKTNGKVRSALNEMESALKQHNGDKTPKKPRAVIGITGLQKAIAGAITQGITYVNSKKEAIDFIKKSLPVL